METTKGVPTPMITSPQLTEHVDVFPDPRF